MTREANKFWSESIPVSVGDEETQALFEQFGLKEKSRLEVSAWARAYLGVDNSMLNRGVVAQVMIGRPIYGSREEDPDWRLSQAIYIPGVTHDYVVDAIELYAASLECASFRENPSDSDGDL